MNPGLQNSTTGIGVNIGFPGGIVVTGISWYLQDADQSADAENLRIFDEIGNRVVSAWFDDHNKFTLTGVIKGTGQAASQAATTLANLRPGTLLTITSAAAMPDAVGTNLEVMSGASIKGSNKDAKKVSFSVEKSANITATMPA